MPGLSSTQDHVRRSLSSLPRRPLLVAGACVALTALAVTARPADDVLPGAAAAAAEREVVTLDAPGAEGSVPLNDVLRSATTPLAATGARATTWHVVATPAAAHPVLRPGDRGPAVAYVQRRLGVKTSGMYGPLTFVAVTAFQKAHGLPAAGLVGPRTWAALTARPAAPASARAAAPVRVAAAPAPARAAAPRVTARVSSGRVCPAPGASFGDGWLVPRAGHLHQGQDLMGRRGMPILAIEDGVVVREGRQRNGALRIVLQGRSGSKFYYGHMSKDLVHAGSRVRRGQVIGLMGDTGSPGAVHLHFEYWRSGGESAAVNPLALLRSVC